MGYKTHCYSSRGNAEQRVPCRGAPPPMSEPLAAMACRRSPPPRIRRLRAVPPPEPKKAAGLGPAPKKRQGCWPSDLRSPQLSGQTHCGQRPNSDGALICEEVWRGGAQILCSGLTDRRGRREPGRTAGASDSRSRLSGRAHSPKPGGRRHIPQFPARLWRGRPPRPRHPGSPAGPRDRRGSLSGRHSRKIPSPSAQARPR